MSKPTKFAGAKSPNAHGGIPFVVFVGLVGLGLLGYVLSQMFLPVEAHTAHWLTALIGAALGGILGWLLYRRRGDII
jgi:LPXTG-motif cell wall-anchored protein